MTVKNQAQANRLWSKILVEELLRCGVEDFCIAPGGRSCSLVTAVSEHPSTRIHVHQDERGLAFFALGQAKATRRASAIICTAGTAVVNFHPAVLEAYHSEVPLIVLSTDLPWEESCRGVNQGMRQSTVFGEHVRWGFDFPAPASDFSWKALVSTIDYAVKQSSSGPVHLNCRFRSPMSDSQAVDDHGFGSDYEEWERSGKPFTSYTREVLLPSTNELSLLVNKLESAKRGVLVVGQLDVDADVGMIRQLARHLNWPILSDPLSQMRFCEETVDGVVHSSHFTIYASDDELRERYKPDLVLHLGGDLLLRTPYAPFNRGIHSLIRVPKEGYILASESGRFHDPFHQQCLRLTCSVSLLCKALIDSGGTFIASELLGPIEQAEKSIAETLSHEAKQQSLLSEPWAVRTVLDSLPDKSGLFVANSLSIREVDYLLSEQRKRVYCGSLHGLKGIDGTLACASGFASGLRTATTVILGDLAALHDLNSLMLCARTEFPLVIVVLNNNGGQIFSYVDASQSPAFEKCFLTPHGLDFRHAAMQFGLKYLCPENIDELKLAYARSIEVATSTVIEIQTHREQLVSCQQEIFSKALEELHK